MKPFLFLLSFCYPFLLFSQTGTAYETDFEVNPSDWTAGGIWQHHDSAGIDDSGVMFGADHTILQGDFELISPTIHFTNTSTLAGLTFSLSMGHFADGNSSMIVFTDYGNGWIPLLGCSENPSAYIHNAFPKLPAVTLPYCLYDLSDNSTWWPNSNAAYTNVQLNLDSLKNYTELRFKFVLHYYYGGVAFLDNVKIESTTIEGVNNAMDESFILIGPNPARDMLSIKLKEEMNELKIVDMMGQVIFSETNVSGQLDIPVAQFYKGIYFVCYQRKGESFFRKKKIAIN